MTQHNMKHCSCRHQHYKYDWIVVSVMFLLIIGAYFLLA